MELIIYPFPHLVVHNALTRDEWEELEACYVDSKLLIDHKLKVNRTPTRELSWKSPMATELMKSFGIAGIPTLGRFMLRRAGYRLRPHIDPPNFILTVLHYIPVDRQDEGTGTILYQTDRRLKHSGDGAAYFKDADCAEALKVPFRRNTMLAFRNTPTSAHGVAALREDRLVYQWHLSSP